MLKTFLVLEIVAATVIGGWLIKYKNADLPPEITPVTPITIHNPETPSTTISTPQATNSDPKPSSVIVVPLPPSPFTPGTSQETPTPPASTPPPTIYVPIYLPQPSPTPPTPSLKQNTPLPPPPTSPSITPTPKISMESITIISPLPTKGLGREYKANDYKLNPDGTLADGSTEPTDINSIFLGLVVRDADGNAIKNATVTVTATDSSQNKELKGTGNMTKVYKNGNPETVPYYPFNYEFKTAGKHTITFSANGLTQSVELDVK